MSGGNKIITAVTDLIERLNQDKILAAGEYYDMNRAVRRRANDPRRWLIRRNLNDPDATVGARAWDSIPQDSPWEFSDVYAGRLMLLLKQPANVLPLKLSDEIEAAEAYFLSHTHKEPFEDQSGLTVMEATWLFLCNAYVRNTSTYTKVLAFRAAFKRCDGLSVSASANSQALLQFELRRRLATFHHGGYLDYIAFTHPTYIKEEEKRRDEFVANDTLESRLRASEVASSSKASDEKSASNIRASAPHVQTKAADAATGNSGATASGEITDRKTLMPTSAPTEPGDEDASIVGTLRHMLRTATEFDFLLACCDEVIAMKEPYRFITWSAQYAWCVFMKRSLLNAHGGISYRPMPTMVAFSKPYFERRLSADTTSDISESWKEIREFLARTHTPAGFYLRTKRLPDIQQKAGLAARAVEDINLVLASAERPFLAENVKQVISTRQTTQTRQYAATPTHPAYDRFRFFYFTLLFQAYTKLDFMRRYTFLGDNGISDPLLTWRFIARRPWSRSATHQPFLPLIVEYGNVIMVRMGTRVYQCTSLVEAACTWCVMVQLYYQDSTSDPHRRLSEDGVDIGGFLRSFLPKLKPEEDMDSPDSRASMLHELACMDKSVFGTSDSEDEKQIDDDQELLYEQLGDYITKACGGDDEDKDEEMNYNLLHPQTPRVETRSVSSSSFSVTRGPILAAAAAAAVVAAEAEARRSTASQQQPLRPSVSRPPPRQKRFPAAAAAAAAGAGAGAGTEAGKDKATEFRTSLSRPREVPYCPASSGRPTSLHPASMPAQEHNLTAAEVAMSLTRNRERSTSLARSAASSAKESSSEEEEEIGAPKRTRQRRPYTRMRTAGTSESTTRNPRFGQQSAPRERSEERRVRRQRMQMHRLHHRRKDASQPDHHQLLQSVSPQRDVSD